MRTPRSRVARLAPDRTDTRRHRTLTKTAVAACVLVLAAAGCGREAGAGEDQGVSVAAASGDFGDLKNVCGPGDASSASAQGVTATQIEVGLFSDIDFTKAPDITDAAAVFVEWCNAAGGINGRELVTNLRDTRLTEVRQRMLEACREDFFLVGGAAALDGLGVEDRLKCLLPEFPAQVTQTANTGSDLQSGGGSSLSEDVNPYTGFYDWLTTQAHPESKIGLLTGDSPITKVMGDKLTEALTASVQRATPERWQAADFRPDTGVFRCGFTPYRYTVDHGKPTTLADVDKSMSDLE